MRGFRWWPLAAVALISCVPEITVAPPEPGTVTVTVASATIVQGTTTQATANAADSRGRALTSEPRTWSTSAPGVATVSASGVVTGVAPGTANITASVLGRSASAAVTVTPAVASVVVTPATASRTYRDTVHFSASARDASNTAIPGRPITWAISTGAAFASVSTGGIVTPVLQPDTVTRTVVVSATADGRTGTGTLTLTKLPVDTIIVTPDSVNRVFGDTVRLVAQPRTSTGTNLTQRVVSWSSSNTAIATVNSSGLVTAVAPGKATITASSEGKSRTAVVVVTNRPVATVELRLPSATTPVTTLSLGSGRSQQLEAILRDSNGGLLTGKTVTWTSSVPAIVSVNASGVVSAVAISGTVTVTASSEGQSASVSVTVGNAAASIVSSATAGMSTVQNALVAATVRDAGSALLPNRAVFFRSTDSTIASVTTPSLQTNASGVATATIRGRTVGSTLVIAESEGRLDTTAVTVSAATVAQLAWDGYLNFATNVTAGLNENTQFSVTPRDNLGNNIPGKTVTWSSSNPTVVSVSTAGVVRGLAAGSAVITATVDAISSTRTVSTQNAVASINTTVTSDTLDTGAQVNLNITPRDAANVALTGRPFTAVSADTSIARVAVIGTSAIQITGGSVGTTTVTVTAGAISQPIAIRVIPISVASVQVAGTTSLQRNNTFQFTATTRDGLGNVLTGRVVTWSSSNTNVATVSSTGLVTGVAGGSATITATSEGVQGTLTVNVVTDVASVTVAPSSFTLTTLGGTQQLTATARNASNVVLSERIVTWSSLNPNVAAVNATTGLVTAVASGSTQIRATVEGVVGSATVTVTVTDPCAPTAHTLGATVNGSLTTTDCSLGAGVYEDRYTFSTGTQASLAWNINSVTPGAVQLRQPLQQGNTNTGPTVTWTLNATGFTAYSVYGAGSYVFSMRSLTTVPQSYGFTTQPNIALPAACEEVGLAIGSGVSISRNLTTSACSLASKYYHPYWIYLNVGQQVTITNTSTAYDAYLELHRFNGTAWVLETTDDDGAGGTNARIVYTATTAGFYEIRATTFLTTTTGTSTLSVTASPLALMAPTDGLRLEDTPLAMPARRRPR